MKRIFHYHLADQLSNPKGWAAAWFLGGLWNKRNTRLNVATLAALDLQTEDRVLEIGFCGGDLLRQIASVVCDGYAAGIDGSEAIVRQARRKFQGGAGGGQPDIVPGQAENIPYPDAFFNKVSSVNSIFYWTDVPGGLSEISRVLAESGWLILTFTCSKDIQKRGFAHTEKVHTFEVKEVEGLLSEAGFHNIQTRIVTASQRDFVCMMGQKRPTR